MPGGKTAVTLYKTLETRGKLSLVECRLADGAGPIRSGCPWPRSLSPAGGRQIRPRGGEPRYGETRQALYSYYLRFDFPTDAGLLNYLRGREFQVENVPFAARYFS